MLDPELLERITARRVELDELEERWPSSWRRYGPRETNSPSPNVSLNG
ncbi:hypothetical protein AB0H07_40310 [Streptomyces sp. NPDC021354]